jgi:hypothetical protein
MKTFHQKLALKHLKHVQPFYGKEPHKLLWVGLWAALE